MKQRVLPVLLLSLVVGGCSVLLSWDPNLQPCDRGKCLSEYTCLVTACVENRSLFEGDLCNKDIQCNEALFCAPEAFSCRGKCKSFYSKLSSKECQEGQYCKPLSADNGDVVGACFNGSGCPEIPCPGLGEVCVQASTSATACLQGCEVTFAAGVYQDDCLAKESQDRYCQPVGIAGSEEFVCQNADRTRGAGASCNAFKTPCSRGTACVADTCRTYCTVGTACANTSESCCAIRGDLGVCKPSC